MRTRLVSLLVTSIVVSGLVASTASAQVVLRDLVVQELDGGYRLVESGPNTSVQMIDEWDALPWRTSFQLETTIVEISAFDYRDLPRALLGHATMADRMEQTLRESDAAFAG